MTRRLLAASAALAMAVFGVVAMTAGPAAAQTDCSGEHRGTPATVTPTSLRPGETLTISGVGFAASTVLGIGLFNPPVVLGTVASNGLGNYTATVTLPFGTPPGQNEITVFGKGSDNACVQSLGLFTVTAPPVPITSAPVVVTPVVVPPVTVIGTGGVIQVVGTTPSTIVVQQPLARTGSASPALVAAGLLAMLLGLHVVRAANRRPLTN
ncbi:MAG: hypothetical protein QOH36_2195 [Actinomycetota bacterium]|nr:hypothetical protein [Actinomycetota bacterium]